MNEIGFYKESVQNEWSKGYQKRQKCKIEVPNRGKLSLGESGLGTSYLYEGAQLHLVSFHISHYTRENVPKQSKEASGR